MAEYVDVHSHILPAVDDGSKNVEESLELLSMLKEQGVTTVIATPHFLGARDNIDDFKARINNAKEELFTAKEGKDLPTVLIGSEILYFYGMGMLEGIKDLTINGSKYMLLEFDFIDFNDNVIKDIRRIRERHGIIPIIAHIERYKKFKNYKKLLKLVETGVCKAQINASSVIDNVFTKNAHKLIEKGYIDFIGSDTHSVEFRPPLIDKAYEVIKEKYGEETAEKIRQNGIKLIENIK
ncbi:MAG: hypothetical protein IJJ40_02030 [Clostridia bacterium]|nr:hypothetical protein [Clostridia bacterium]